MILCCKETRDKLCSDHVHKLPYPMQYYCTTRTSYSFNFTILKKCICTLFSKNDIISSVRKRYYALGLVLGLELRLRFSEMFSVNRVFLQV